MYRGPSLRHQILRESELKFACLMIELTLNYPRYALTLGEVKNRCYKLGARLVFFNLLQIE